MEDAVKPLAGKVALVTGASRGIGRAIALQLGKEGALVAVHYGSSPAGADEVVDMIEAEGGNAFAVGADLSRAETIGPMYEAVDRELEARTGTAKIDILVNNAGVGGVIPIEQTSVEAFDAMFAVNARALFFVCQQALPRLRDGGRIIIISSSATRGAKAGLPAYAMSKIPANSLTQSLAAAVGPRQITVNALLPGYVETDLTTELRANPAIVSHIVGETALGRPGQPQDIASVVSLLVSPKSGWITGQLIETSGGSRL